MHPLIPWFETPSIPIAGGVAIHGFGVLVALGFWVGTLLASRKAGRDGLNAELPNELVGWLIGGTFIGGHVFHMLFYERERLISHPIELLYVWDGLSSSGGLITCVFITVWFFRVKKKLPFLPYGDAVAWGLMTGWIFGRLGCFVAHDHPGNVSNFWLAVQPGDPARTVENGRYVYHSMCPGGNVDGNGDGILDYLQACHDMGLYESFWAMSMAPLFFYLDRKPRFPGFFLGMIAVLYAPYRFLSDFLRHPTVDERYWGLTPAQLFTIVLFGVGITMLTVNRHRTPVRLQAEPTDGG